jgi:hypothetical protein
MVVYYGLVNVVECICCGCKRDGHFDENNYGGLQFLFSPFDHGCVLADSPVVPPTVSYSPPRIALDNIADQLIALSEDVMPSLPEPLRSPPYITPRPVLPDIPIPPPDNDIELDLRHQS